MKRYKMIGEEHRKDITWISSSDECKNCGESYCEDSYLLDKKIIYARLCEPETIPILYKEVK